MTPWLILLPVGLVMGCGAWLTYAGPAWKEWAGYPWLMAGLAAANGLLWAWACRLTEGRTTYALSAAWDATTVVSYSVLPLLLFGVRLTPTAAVGVGMVVAGACLVKWG